MELTITDLEGMAQELLSVFPKGLSRSVEVDISRLTEEMGKAELADVIKACFIIAYRCRFLFSLFSLEELLTVLSPEEFAQAFLEGIIEGLTKELEEILTREEK